MTMPDENASSGQGEIPVLSTNPENFCEEIEAYITEKPLQSLGIALLIGIIVGKVIL